MKNLKQCKIEDKKQFKNQALQPSQPSQPLQGDIGSTNQKTEYFSFMIQNPVEQDDPTVAWTYNVPILMPSQKSLYLCTQSFTTIIQDFVGDDFPQQIAISLEGYSGFVALNGALTSKIIVLTLSDINTVCDQNNVVSRDLIYKNEVAAFWPLGTQRTLKFRLLLNDDTQFVNLPLSNPLCLTFKILHMAM